MLGLAHSYLQSMSCVLAQAGPVGATTLPADAAASTTMAPPLSPVLILVLCVIAGVGTVLLLPSRREAAIARIGGIIALAAAAIFAAVLIREGNARFEGGMGVYFWVFSVIAIVGAIRVITHPRPVYSALYFVLTVMATAGLFVLLWAEFMAVALVLIYAGAILVTYVFVIMLAAEAAPAQGGTGSLSGLSEHDAVSREPLIACAVGFAVMGVLLFVIFDKGANISTFSREGAIAEWAVAGDSSLAVSRLNSVPATARANLLELTPTQQLGDYLFSYQLVNLELAGLILTVAMVGAIMIARRKVINPEAVGEDIVSTPATPIDDNPHSIPVYGTENPRQKAYPET